MKGKFMYTDRMKITLAFLEFYAVTNSISGSTIAAIVRTTQEDMAWAPQDHIHDYADVLLAITGYSPLQLFSMLGTWKEMQKKLLEKTHRLDVYAALELLRSHLEELDKVTVTPELNQAAV